jgi:hypothetical protein
MVTNEEEKAKELAEKNGWAPKPKNMNLNSWAMGRRQIAQAKMRGSWRGNRY